MTTRTYMGREIRRTVTCVHCRAGVPLDEDGCCGACGADALGAYSLAAALSTKNDRPAPHRHRQGDGEGAMKTNSEMQGALNMVLARLDSEPDSEAEWAAIAAALKDAHRYALRKEGEARNPPRPVETP